MATHMLNTRDSLAMIDRSVRLSLRQADTLLLSIVMPVFIMLTFVYVFGGALEVGGDYKQYVVPGVIVLCAGYRAASTAVAVASDMERGVIGRFRSLPIASASVLVGHVAASVLANVVATTIVFAVAFATGFRPTATPLEWVGVAGLLLLFVLAISWLSTALGLLVKNVEAAGSITFFMLFLPYLSSGFVPTESMPGPLQAFAEHQPFTPLIDATRSLLVGTPMDNAAWLAIAWFGSLLVGGLSWSVWLFTRQGRH